MSVIEQVRGRQILDSRGDPTVEVEVTLDSGALGRAAVPAGASTGKFEALDLRDGGQAWLGRGVTRALAHVEGEIAAAVAGLDPADQLTLDAALTALDGTAGLHRLGGNAVLGVSLASAHAAAADAGVALWRHLAGGRPAQLPLPMMNVLEGGRHGDSGLLVQDVMVVPLGATSFQQAVQMGAETHHAVGGALAGRGLHRTVGDGGGFAAHFDSVEQALGLVIVAIEAAGYEPGSDIALAVDCAAAQLADSGGYRLDQDEISSGEEMIGWWLSLCTKYPITAVEDPLSEEDWSAWRQLTGRLRGRTLVVGDDLFCTRPSSVQRGVEERLATAALIKPNQVGTLSETLRSIQIAGAGGLTPIMAHRAGETEDTTIADLAVATSCPLIKAGAPCRSEHVAKYNRLLLRGGAGI
jgi:enolase